MPGRGNLPRRSAPRRLPQLSGISNPAARQFPDIKASAYRIELMRDGHEYFTAAESSTQLGLQRSSAQTQVVQGGIPPGTYGENSVGAKKDFVR